MKTVLEYDTGAQRFLEKKSILALYRKKDKKLLGQTNFDLSIYANKVKSIADKLMLQDSEYPDSYIEIFIKAAPLDPTSSTTPMSRRTT